ncbi:MAG TPA: DNA primase [Acidiferrobacter sp.]|nr:DNA primase [Acidiferrobacter sp.]
MAGKIPSPFIDAVLARTDIIELVGARVPLRKAGKDYKACCPFHEERTPSFTVSGDKQFYHCFGCGVHGSAIGFLMEYERLSFVEAVTDLAHRAGLEMPEEGRKMAPAGPDLKPVLAAAASYFQEALRRHPMAERVHTYLKGRGITGVVAKTFQLGYAPASWDGLLVALGKEYEPQLLERAGLVVARDNGSGYYDRFRDRVMFPIIDAHKRVIGFGGRVLDQGEPKYMNSPETPLFHKGHELYGLPQALAAIEKTQRVLVVEGYMDVIALSQLGVPNVVATLGTATTREHLERLFRFAPEIVFCFDGDRAGREAAWRALEQALSVLRDGRQVSFLFLPEGEDPDTLIRSEGATGFGDRLRSAMELPEFFFETLAARADLGRLDGRARLVELAKPLLSKLAKGALYELMIARLGELSALKTAQAEDLVPARKEAPKPVRQASQVRGGSLVRQAVALLLQYPALIKEVGLLPPTNRPGMEVLTALVDLLRETPGLTTGAIVERFAGTEHQAVLARLVMWEYPSLLPDQGGVLRDIMTTLATQARETDAKIRYKFLLNKGNLTPDEQAELVAYRRDQETDS